MKTYFNKTTGIYLGSYDGPAGGNPFAGHTAVNGCYSGLHRLVDGVVEAISPPSVLDPDEEIQSDIRAATNFDELKAALLGEGPTGTKVRGRK